MIEGTVKGTTRNGIDYEIAAGFRPNDKDAVHAALKLIGERFNDQPMLQNWLAGTLWDTYQATTGQKLEVCRVCGRQASTQLKPIPKDKT